VCYQLCQLSGDVDERGNRAGVHNRPAPMGRSFRQICNEGHTVLSSSSFLDRRSSSAVARGTLGAGGGLGPFGQRFFYQLGEEVSTNMAPTHGRCRRGQRLYAKVPHGHWKTTTFVAALRHDGITAPFVLDGQINGEGFLAYVKEVLAPTLSEGDIVLIDNLTSHKSPKIRKAIEAEGAELRFLPRYSPDLNPIEMAFSKLKTLLRKLPNDPSKPSGSASANSSVTSHRMNVKTTSERQDMNQPDRITR